MLVCLCASHVCFLLDLVNITNAVSSRSSSISFNSSQIAPAFCNTAAQLCSCASYGCGFRGTHQGTCADPDCREAQHLGALQHSSTAVQLCSYKVVQPLAKVQCDCTWCKRGWTVQTISVDMQASPAETFMRPFSWRKNSKVRGAGLCNKRQGLCLLASLVCLLVCSACSSLFACVIANHACRMGARHYLWFC